MSLLSRYYAAPWGNNDGEVPSLPFFRRREVWAVLETKLHRETLAQKQNTTQHNTMEYRGWETVSQKSWSLNWILKERFTTWSDKTRDWTAFQGEGTAYADIEKIGACLGKRVPPAWLESEFPIGDWLKNQLMCQIEMFGYSWEQAARKLLKEELHNVFS